MKTKIRVKWRTFLVCWVAAVVLVVALGIRAITQDSAPAAGTAKPQEAYILINTTDGESWGFYGEVTIEPDGCGGTEITLDRAWIVGADHECFNAQPEE